ncbi:4'-phosphopantetheinyl transferase superfamily protein [Martelella alba]|uniref:4'-phosphopantetheinyl transferase superfamily protein n=1 Tax=Martelella alba TaxID=2590451 RepID=UPI001E352335|nr:4'-phosphopantetheinyl transferase superfamily protein [Martelella alba]
MLFQSAPCLRNTGILAYLDKQGQAQKILSLSGNGTFSGKSALPDMIYGRQGKPAFANGPSLWFTFSHCGDNIALFLSDEGEVGCDIEVIQPRAAWRDLADALFSPGERAGINAAPAQGQFAAFWRVWTRKEAFIKQRGGGVWRALTAPFPCPSSQPLPVGRVKSGGVYAHTIQTDDEGYRVYRRAGEGGPR